MFSIIVPLYNKALYVEKAIYSILNQTYKEYELIIINDGSTDDSKDVVERIQLSAIDYKFINQANQGVSATRNNGVRIAKYDFIAFLDADDWWETTYLEEMKNLIEEFPEAGLYGSNYFIVKNAHKNLSTIGVDDSFRKGLINYCQVYARTLCMPLWTGATIVNKAIFDSVGGFKVPLKLGEDFDLWIRIALIKNVAFLNKPLACYNQDVELINRQVVLNKLFPPKSHFAFNLEFLKESEAENNDLKVLLDKLRVYNLLRYRLQSAYLEEVDCEISKVDFRNVSFISWFNYHSPLMFVKLLFKTRQILSLLKSKLK